MPTENKEPDPWQACTFEGSREEALRRGQRMTFREKIMWLEQAARLSQTLARARRQQPQRPGAR